MSQLLEQRYTAVHLLRAGHSVAEVADQLKRHPNWVRKWYQRYQAKGWVGLKEQSRAPKEHGTKLSAERRRAICQARSELEAEAATGQQLKYIGARAVKKRLKAKKIKPLPSRATIERVLQEHQMTRAKKKQQPPIQYPHLKPTKPHQLCQVDIVPHYLPGGERVACFNAIDVVSRYPTGQALAQRRAQDATEFLVHVWQEIGIGHYTQVDNEGCFSGGATHPYVLGKVVRLALAVGTELVFSPFYHPESNGTVERFHQEYDRHVWEETDLRQRRQVQTTAEQFFQLYRQSDHHAALDGLTPAQCHSQVPVTRLSADFVQPKTKLPLYEGRVHFIRRVNPTGTVSVLNIEWAVPEPDPTKGVWVTLEFRLDGATLSIYDAAPDAGQRTCLVAYPFPLSETVLAQPAKVFEPHPPDPATPQPASSVTDLNPQSAFQLPPALPALIKAGKRLLRTTCHYTLHLTCHFVHTIY